MPKPVQELLRVVYLEQIDLSQINREDFAIPPLLKAHQPAIYESLQQEVATRRAKSTTSLPFAPLAGRYISRDSRFDDTSQNYVA